MHGMGTILNVVLIICGSLLGLFIRHRMKENLKENAHDGVWDHYPSIRYEWHYAIYASYC